MKLSEAIRGRATTHKEQVILWPKQLFAWAADAAAQEAEVERLRGALEALGYIPCTFKEDRQDRLAGTCIDGTVVCESSGYICEDCEGTGWIYDPIAAAQEASR